MEWLINIAILKETIINIILTSFLDTYEVFFESSFISFVQELMCSSNLSSDFIYFLL